MKNIKIGLLATPELAADIAEQLKEEFSSMLGKYISEDINWVVETQTDSITSVAEDSKELLEGITERQEKMEWDYTVSLTDIPLFYKDEILLGRVNSDHNIAFLSLPAFGWFLKKRIKKMVLQVIKDMYYKDSKHLEKEHEKIFHDIFTINKIEKIKRKEKGETVLRYVNSSPFMGRMTLLSGMTFDNKPWTLIPALRSVLAIAFSSGAYGMIFPTLWQLSYNYSSARLIALTFLSIVSITLWIIQAHKLWETEEISHDEAYRKLYNATTVSTLLFAVLLFYLALFILYLITAFFLVEPHFFMQQTNLSSLPTLLNYLELAWMTASVGTITGAVGVGLEDEESVRNATYGYRQRQRYDRMQEKREKEASPDDN